MCLKWSVKNHHVAKILQGIWERFLHENHRNYNSWNLVISSPLFLFCPFIETKSKNQIDKSIQQESNLIDVYKRIFLHIIPVHIIVPWYRERRYLKLSLCRTIFSVPYLDCFLYAISNIWMRFSSKSYCSFQAFEFNNCIGKTLFGSLMILLWSQVLLRLNTLQNLRFFPKLERIY